MSRHACWQRVSRTAAFGVTLGVATPLAAQSITQPAQPWRTLTTAHFVFHTPAALEPWTRHVAARMESYATAVTSFVGHAPSGRVTVIVDDPSGDANGFAVPLLGRPVMMIWPTPPAPSLTFGEYRSWGEILALHEFAHIAHLTYPSRNPRERFFWSLLPAQVGPVARKTPPWAFEGFATLVEGRLTGVGRPHSAIRAAVLRQWALEGKLPAYGALDNLNTFLGGVMRYLLGSAYLEWLAERKGDVSLEHVWRRLSAREPRTFNAAFAGVYGAAPADLYGRFVVQLTEQALRARSAVAEVGVLQGDLFQHLAWNTGDPAVSPDGAHIAVALRQPNQPSRLVVWQTASEGIDSALLRRRARILARDSLDVPPFDSFPLPRRAVATLRSVAGAGYNNPRWLTDGARILVSREVPLGNGGARPDLFLWSWKTGHVRRLTRGAGMRFADSAPDGRRAVASRCDAGRCGLSIVDLASGAWRDLVPGSFDVSWHRPRWSPDGRRVAASVQREGRWQIGVVEVASGQVAFVAPNDSASRHSPAWMANALVVVSDRGGIPNLERVDPDAATIQTLTRVVGAVVAPDVGVVDGTIWYLDLHAGGLDLRRLASAAPTGLSPVELSPALRPITPLPRAAGVPFDSSSAVAAQGYGLGPRVSRYFPGFGVGADGAFGVLAITNYDPAGRLGVLAQGAYGTTRAWRGASLGIAWHGWAPFDVLVQAFTAKQRSQQNVGDLTYAAGALAIGRAFTWGATAWSWQLGASAGSVGYDDAGTLRRIHTHAEAAYAWRRTYGLWRQVGARVLASGGQTADTDVRRGQASLGATAAAGSLRLRLSAAAGRLVMDSDSLSVGRERFEAFSVGGLAPPLFDERLLPQRISVPALPAASSVGRAYAAYRAALSQSGQPVSLYAAWFKVYDPSGRWQRLIGGEGEQVFPSIGFASLPNVTLQYGAAYSLDDPRRHRWTLYGGARFAP